MTPEPLGCIYLGKSKINNTGVLAAREIAIGESIYKMEPGTYPHILISEILKWPQEKRENFLRYSFQAGPNEYYGNNNNSFEDDVSFFMNHSCEPNTWYKDDFEIVARSKINADEELTLDYATIMSPSGLEESFECNCGSKKCRKIVQRTDCLSPKLQKEYKGHFLSFINK